jgi:CHAT domain-containing protein
MSRYFFVVILIFSPLAVRGQIALSPTADDTTIANQYFAKAEKFAKATQYDSSIYYYQMAGVIYEKKAIKMNIPRLWERYITCCNNMGANFTSNWQFAEALHALNTALQTGLRVFGENRPFVANSYHRLGNLYSGMGDHDKKLEFWKKALAIRLKILGENHPDVARSYGNLALPYADAGDIDTAILYYEKVLTIFRQAYGEEHQDVARAYENMGVLCGSTYPEKAFECYNNALSIRLKVFGENHPETARTHSNLALYYQNKRAYDKALTHYEKALQIWRQRFGEKNLEVAKAYRNIGVTYYEMRDYQRAFEYYNKDLSIELSLLNIRHPELSFVYQKLGKLYNVQNDHENALRYYQKSIICSVPDFADSNFYVNPSLSQMNPSKVLLLSLQLKAEAFQALSQQKSDDHKALQMALSTFRLTLAYIDKIRNSYKAEGAKLALGQKFNAVYEGTLQASLHAYNLTGQAGYKDDAFLFVEKNKAATLAQALQESRARQFAGIPAHLLEKERNLKIDLTACETELEKQKQNAQRKDRAKLHEYQNQYFTLKRNYDKLISRFEKSYPQYYDLKYKTQTVSVAELQRTLDNQTALLEYFLGDSTIFIFAVTKGSFNVVATQRDSVLDNTITVLANSFKNLTSKAKYIENASLLYRFLIKPLEFQIANCSHWVIVPDGELHQIPFDALLNEAVLPAVDAEYGSLPYLIKRHKISYHYSATLFLKSGQQQKKASNDNLLAGFAPVFSQSRKNGNLFAINFDSMVVARPDALSYLVTRDGKVLDELTYSELEVRNILTALLGRGHIYLHEDASEENFKKNIKNHKYVHIATHGFINNENSKLSNLAFSQPQNKNATEDGILYSGETYNLDLNADLLVLSACQTGAGQIIKGEGLMALTRGFLYSGARNIVASLWKVYDEHTSRLMVEFYRQIEAGKGYSTALREAKLKMIANPETAGPQSWASFVLIGR